MNKGMLTVGIILLSLIALLLINVLTNYSTGGELDYYMVKEVTTAAMGDSLDPVYYTNCGERRMFKEKFVENFTRRFTENSTFGEGNYSIVFYDIMESPPKVSLRIIDNTNTYNIYNIETDAQIVNEITAILDGYK